VTPRPARLTLFTIPKPFAGQAEIHQANALRSWRSSLPGVEIVVCGDEPGARRYAEEVGAIFLPQVERNRYGTPLLGSTFRAVAARASHPILAYANADILLLPDLDEALGRLEGLPSFLLVGRRWNLDLDEHLSFGPGWAEALRDRVRSTGQPFRRDAIDLFVFPTGSHLLDLPPFAVGRPGWDNYVLYRARQLEIPVVDATAAVTLVHQNHGYGHVPEATGDRWEGPEARENRALIGGTERIFDIGDATHLLGPGGLAPARGARRALRALETAHLRHPWLRPVGRLGFALRGLPALAARLFRPVPGRRP